MSKTTKKQPNSRVATKKDIDQLEARMATKEDIKAVRSEMATKEDIKAVRSEMATDLKQIRSEMATKKDLDQVRSEMATTRELEALDGKLESRMRMMEGNIREDFDIKLEEKFIKYTDKVTRGLDQVMGELANIREDNIARNEGDRRVNRRLNRLEKHTGLSPFAD